MTDIKFQSEVVFARYRKVLNAARRDILAEVATMPAAASPLRKRWMYQQVQNIDGMLKGKQYLRGNTVVVQVPGLADKLAAETPVAELYRGGLEDAQSRVGISFNILDKNVLAYSANYELGYLRNLGDETRMRVSQAIRTSVLRGEGTRELAKRLTGAGLSRGVFSTVAIRAKLVARTETAEIVIGGRMDGYRELEVEEVKVVGRATSCPICSAVLGKVFPIDEAPELPLHPNCVHDVVPYKRKGVVIG